MKNEDYAAGFLAGLLRAKEISAKLMDVAKAARRTLRAKQKGKKRSIGAMLALDVLITNLDAEINRIKD
jgi:hypothetical protein